MTDPTKPPPEEHYALLFPKQAIPAWALDKMELFDDSKFTVREGVVETVPLAQVVGTNHARYGNNSRWLDMLTRAKKSSNFRLDNWPGFLDADTSNIVLVRIAGSEKFYIYFGGNHRVSALKLAGKLALKCQVQVAHPKLTNDENAVRRVDDLA